MKGKILLAFLPLLSVTGTPAGGEDLSVFLEGVTSGYFLKVDLTKKEEPGTLSFYFDGKEAASTYVGEEASVQKTFALDNADGRLVYGGEKELSFRFAYLSGGGFEKDFSLAGLEDLPSYAEGDALSFPVLKEGGKTVSSWTFALLDPEEYVPPSDVPFVLSDFLTVSVPSFLEGNLAYRLYLGSSSYPLEAKKCGEEGENVLLSLSGKTAFLNGEEADSLKVFFSFSAFTDVRFTLSLPFLSFEAFQEGGWSYVFS